ncbi:MAG: DNA-processing protein DprA [Planctomycetaceae bacterium]|jgi:DNA processing protein|nr:DNA-processing protein DprA [Planctomycetaceae bacterium]
MLLDDITLSMVEGIGSGTVQKLLDAFGSSTAVLDGFSRTEVNRFDFLKPETAQRLLSARKNINPEPVLELCRRKNIGIIPLSDPQYPEQLRSIHDPPFLLYIQGKILPQDSFSLAVIGTRRITSYGRRTTEKLTKALVANCFTVNSGLALGIDSVAHRSALKYGGRTLAVLGSGHCRLYPPEHRELAEQIASSGGAVISEHPPLHPSASWTFPQRNRIVSGLSLGVLVVEAPLRSGAMITARLAGEQGRDIFTVPGPIDSEVSRGCHQLLRNGAYLAESVDDILNVLGPMNRPVLLPGFEKPVQHPNELSLNEIEAKVLRHIGAKPATLQELAAAAGLEIQQIAAVISVLEEKRIVRRTTPDKWMRI